MEWYLKVLKNYATFDGRARRKEYWMFTLFNIIISIVLGFIEGFFGGPGIIGLLYALAILIPGMAVTVRRLHDIGKSGWWIFISLVPILGALVLLFFLIQEGHSENNSFGPNPKLVAA